MTKKEKQTKNEKAKNEKTKNEKAKSQEKTKMRLEKHIKVSAILIAVLNASRTKTRMKSRMIRMKP